MGACATKPKAVDGTAPEVAPAEQPAPAEVTREVEAVVVAAEESSQKVEETKEVTAVEVAEPKAETVTEEAQKGEEATSEVKELEKAVGVEEKPKTEETTQAS
ncbi:myristoylated alanine-rich C-kinase substrate-like protein [Carex littledalei]|uniref:Myristoylated alanine-rich C-kinase substrate-like protein n=1 Tax=Carex littledalei TaxID=544730 RepID=A0A833R393_9POAL|nr:myristoylated alanine-rich C-kinase substrate-like protein [Carex littledalei]